MTSSPGESVTVGIQNDEGNPLTVTAVIVQERNRFCFPDNVTLTTADGVSIPVTEDLRKRAISRLLAERKDIFRLLGSRAACLSVLARIDEISREKERSRPAWDDAWNF
ncbi:MAG: hypothetical protein V1908_00550 [Candidatus Peregrinibacteria bacterium]